MKNIKQKWPAVALLSLGLFGMAGACGPTNNSANSGSSNGTSSSSGPGGGDCNGPAVFERNGCLACHGENGSAGLDLRAEGLDARLVDVESRVPGCDGRLLIDPADPAQSQILTVLSPPAAGSLCTVVMPPGKPSIPADDIACLEKWVAGFAPVTPQLPFEPVAMESALSKVKMLLVGQAPTADELAQVTADQTKLRTIIEAWMETPEFLRKTQDVLRLLLQQKERPTDWQQIDGFNHAGVPDELGRALAESFVQTAVDIVAKNRPFTDVFTTRRWKVTTAQLVVMRYMDQTANERGQLKHQVVLNPGDANLQNGRWYVDGMPAKCREINGLDLEVPEILRLQWGHLRCRGMQDYRFYGTARMNRSGPDYNDFREVEFVPTDPNGPLSEPPFWDVDTWRNVPAGAMVKTRLPRMGFMTTPAFFNNWETNGDNQFRVTVNQTLIVALHGTFRVGEPTNPLHLDGVDSGHAQEGTACFGCHRQMDPMRVWFQNDFGTNYQSVDSGLPSYKPGFAFGGSTFENGDFSAFANFLALHPAVATAWTQKLCWYANGEACNTSDPEFIRVADAFKNGFSWKKLIVELFSSPLVTGLAESSTWKGRDIPMSLVRAQHACAAIDHRQSGQLCTSKNVADRLELIPDDGFSRAAVDPDVPREMTAFSSAALEKLCMELADKLVGGSKAYDPSTPDTTIPAMVEGFIGIPVGHSRHDLLVTGLKAHYNDALGFGANAGDAMKSALILGCSSPDAAAMGL
jgi:hypothetical protein